MTPFFLWACAAPPDFASTPSELAFGEVSFDGDLPEDGYASEIVAITNVGSRAHTLTISAWDDERLCLAGFETLEPPLELGEVQPGSAYEIVLGICGYVSGEVGSEVEVVLDVQTSGEPAVLSVPVSYVPTRFEDTGR